MTPAARAVNSNLRLLAALGDPTFRPWHETLISNVSRAYAASLSTGGGPNALITGIRSSANSMSATIAVDRPAIAVASLMAYPGWYGTIDGRATELYSADGGLLSARIPAGRHIVRLSYRPQVFVVGFYISLLSGAVFIGAAIVARFTLGSAHRLSQ